MSLRYQRDRDSHHRTTPRPEPVGSCICDTGGPLITATFIHQALDRIVLEHRSYCPEPDVALNLSAYLSRKERRPL